MPESPDGAAGPDELIGTSGLRVGDAGAGALRQALAAGYPAISVPAGQVCGLPAGVSFMGPAWSEPRLIALAYAFEQAAQALLWPGLRPTVAAGG